MNPEDLMMFLKGTSNSVGTAAPDAPPPLQPPPTPNAPSPIADIAQPQGPQIPQTAATQQTQRLQGIKGYLSNILHGVGEGMKAHLGMETDAQQQSRVFKQNLETQKFQNEQLNTESEIKFRSSQIQDAQLRLKQQQTAADYSRFDFQKDPISGKISVFDKSKAIDLLKQGKDPSEAFTTYDSRGGGTGASIDSIDKQILSQAGIDPNGLSPQEKAAHAAALFEAKLKGDPKPLLDWTNNAANRSIRLAPTVTNTTETKELSSGELVQIPKTSTSQKVGGVVPGAPKAPVSLSTSGGVRTLIGKDGQPLRGKGSVQMMVGTDSEGKQIAGTPQELSAAGVSNFVKLGSAESDKVNTARQLTSPNGLFGLIDKDLAQFKPGELEALGPRWNEFMAGTIGTADPRYIALRTHVNGLLSTALMQAHVGARGGERIMEHFEDIANAGKMSLPTLKAALAAERQYVEEKAMRPTAKKNDPLGIL